MMKEPKFTFIEAPLYQGQKHFGVSLGPAYLRQCLLDQGYLFDQQIISEPQSQTNLIMKPYETLCRKVKNAKQMNQIIFVAGGDHSLSLGSIQGLLQVNPNLKVIWVDAHGDINTRSSSTTGSFHGMPLSFLLGLDHMPEQKWIGPILKPENLIYFGVRDLDPAEKIFLERDGIKSYSPAEIERRGLITVVNEIMDLVAGSDVHFSIDSDAFDPSIAPATGVCVNDGLTYESVAHLVHQVTAAANVKSFDYVELNPQIGDTVADAAKTAQIGIDLFHIILEQNLQKESSYGIHDRQCHSAEPDFLHASF